MPTPNEFLAELVTDNGIVTGGRFQAIAAEDLPRPGPPLLPGQYALATVTVDQWGRVTNASAGAARDFTPADSGQIVYVDALGDLAGSPYFTFDDGTGTGVATIVFGGAGPPARSGQFFFYDTTTGFNVSLYCDADELLLSRLFGTPAFVAPVVKVRSGTAGADELQLTYASGRAVLTNPKASGTIDLVAKSTVNVQESGGTAGTDELQLAYAAGAATVTNPKAAGTITVTAAGGTSIVGQTSGKIALSLAAANGQTADMIRLTEFGTGNTLFAVVANGGAYFANNCFLQNSRALSWNSTATFNGGCNLAGASDNTITATVSGFYISHNSNSFNPLDIRPFGSSSGTSTVYDAIVIHPQSAGTPGAGFGSQIKFQAQSSTTNARNQGLVTSTWASATDASRKGQVSLWAYDATAAREGLRVETDGSVALIGFLGTAAVAQQTSGANLTNNVTSGGTNDTIADFTDLVIYANDAATIRNDIYQLARKLKQVNDALRLFGLLT